MSPNEKSDTGENISIGNLISDWCIGNTLVSHRCNPYKKTVFAWGLPGHTVRFPHLRVHLFLHVQRQDKNKL